MASRRNRRAPSGTGSPRRASPSRSGNRRHKGDKRAPRARVDPRERKTRNRTYLLVGLLAIVNLYVFIWRDQATLTRLTELPDTAVRSTPGPLPPMASAPAHACSGDPVRIFDGLDGLIRLETQLVGGDTLRLGMLGLGIPGDEIDRSEAAVRTKVDLGLLGGSGAPVRLAADRHGRVHAIEIELAEGHLLQACRDGGELRVRNIQHPLRTDVLVVGIELGRRADLSEAVADADESPELARLIARTIAFDVDMLTESRPGDEIQVMVEKRWLGRTFHRYGKVLAIRYIGAAGRVAFYRYKPEGGQEAFFDGTGKPMRRVLMRSPVAYHPVDPDARGMLTPDVEIIEGRIGAAYRQPEGAPLQAVADGVVLHAGRRGDFGLVLELELADGRVVRYAHLMRLLGDLEPGTRIAQGQIVGLAGHTGKTANDRVRFEIWRPSGETHNLLDPMTLTAKGERRPAPAGPPIDDDRHKRFVADVGPWGKALRAAAG